MNPLPCTNGQEIIMMVRTTILYASSKYFIIRDDSGVIRYNQLSVYDNNGYSWTVTLCKATQTIHLSDSSYNCGYYWSSGSML